MEVLEEGDDPGESNTAEEEVTFEAKDEISQISINAMCASSGFHTMRIKGQIGKTTPCMLVDSGNTHNIMDEHLAY